MPNFGFAQKAIVFNNEGKFLTLFRTETAPTRPNTWDLPGGDLEYGEDPADGIIREIKEEAGLDVRDVELLDVESHYSEFDKIDWVTIAYKCFVVDPNQDVQLSYEHNDFKWVNPKEFLELESAEKLRRFVSKLK